MTKNSQRKMSTKEVKSVPGEGQPGGLVSGPISLKLQPTEPVDPVSLAVDPVSLAVDPVSPAVDVQNTSEEEAFDSLHKRKNWLTTAAATPWLDDEAGAILEAEESRVASVSTVITVAVEEEMIFEAESAHEEFHTHDHSEGEGEEGPGKKGAEETTPQEAVSVPTDSFSLEPSTSPEPSTAAGGDVSAAEPAVSFPTDATPAQSTTDLGVSEPLTLSGGASSVEMPVTAPSEGGIGTSAIDGAPAAPTLDDGSSALSNSADPSNGQLSSTEASSSSIGSSSSSSDSADSGIDHSSSLAGDPLVAGDNSNSGLGDSSASGPSDSGLGDSGLIQTSQPDQSSLNHNQLDFF